MVAGLGASPEAIAKATEELRANDQRFVREGRLVTERKLWVVSARNP
jgi:hypothetical protein